jgi:hypothetical protein
MKFMLPFLLFTGVACASYDLSCHCENLDFFPPSGSFNPRDGNGHFYGIKRFFGLKDFLEKSQAKSVHIDLKDVGLNSQAFKELTQVLKNFKKVQKLTLALNNIESLDTLDHLSFLESLDLSMNRIHFLPFSIAGFNQLKTLDLSGNRIQNISFGICPLSLLENLNLARNQIQELPEPFGQLTNLKTLSLVENPLSSLPHSMKDMVNLEWVDVRGTQITSVAVLPIHVRIIAKNTQRSSWQKRHLDTARGVNQKRQRAGEE